ncbi:MAG TPA: nuclease [Nitrospirae bacterium]|nr:nuclease [Nitrospirota bacterium]
MLCSPSYASDKFRVTEVHDGDTVSIRISSFIGIPFKNERVRLIGIDAPELKQEPWGRLSKKYLKKLLSENDWVVRVEFDVDKRDQYNRLLAYFWAKDGSMINEKMLSNGYAVLYTLPPNVKYVNRLKKAQKQAQQGKKGIWGKSGLNITPEQWRQSHPRH